MTEFSDEDVVGEERHRREAIRAVFSFLIALVVIVLCFLFGVMMFLNREKPETVVTERPIPAVRTQAIEVRQVIPELESEGVIESRREVKLAAQVSGRVEWISDQLIAGGRVAEGEVLVRIESEDLRARLAAAESALADAGLSLETEQARGEQARRDWEKLGRGEPSALTLREPQIASAREKVASATAEVERAGRDVERTEIRAPFGGRVRSGSAEVGAILSPGSAVAELYADADLEVTLAFPLRDFGFIESGEHPKFEVSSMLGGDRQTWPAQLVRVSGEVDRTTLTGQAVAKVEANEGGYPPVGLFVDAKFPGKPIEGAVEVPRSTIRGLDEIWVVREGRLARLRVEELWTTRDTVVVRADFEPGDRLLLTRMSTPVEGTEVREAEEAGE
ncbi:RND family efflux transporter MFP subunit [Haloferula luteola]|uniref:RND family efflux transporter MFP subunit n=1 Tax=Haloferula luteola TaxID=595692 RepID=A0A840VGM8_9BACT|nr:efflux RND transporter periplasmic adaptor subunit [Haloferula luteola]MBB5352979.1 RND family efflux transporter MFP subunit [Haloferula luteola]